MNDEITGVARQSLGKVQNTAEDLEGDTAAQAKRKLNEAAGVAQEAIGDLKDGVREQIEATLSSVRERLHDQLDTLEDYVASRPLPAIAVAGVIGLVLGMLLIGRRKTVYLRDRR